MSRRVRVLALSAAAAAGVVALVVFGFAPSRKAAAGRAAPGLPSEHLGGAAVTLPSLLQTAGGKPTAIVFWASWCGPCNAEAPALRAFAQSAEGQGRIVGVDWSDERSSALAFIRRYGWTFPTVRDAEGLVGDAWGMSVLPTTFVLDGRGRIAATLRGPQTGASLSRALAAAESA